MYDAGIADQQLPSRERVSLCIGCGYNLRGLPADGACPECSMAIERSLHGEWLRYADPQWTQQILRGLSLAGACLKWLVWGIIGVLCVTFAGSVLLPANRDTTTEFVLEWVVNIALAILLIGPVGIIVGLWMASRLEPRMADEQANRATVHRGVTAMALPMFALWGAADDLPVLTAYPVILHALVMTCFAVIWLHALVMADLTLRLRVRCRDLSPATVESARKNVRHTLAIGVIFIAAYWIGPTRGWFTMPTIGTAERLLGFTLLAWLFALAPLVRTRPRIEQELACRPAS